MGFQRRPRLGLQLLDECPYPQLFNSETSKCEDFVNVTCGTRKEPKAPCEYRKRQCQVAHCRPCWAVTPSCVNASDGLHFDTRRMWTPVFVECKQERTISVRRCDPLNDIPQIFSPELLQCVSIYDVPRQFNGLRPNCVGSKTSCTPRKMAVVTFTFSAPTRRTPGMVSVLKTGTSTSPRKVVCCRQKSVLHVEQTKLHAPYNEKQLDWKGRDFVAMLFQKRKIQCYL
ncbi:uncharacterized protein LOC135471018 [Liolophura sinensis]|uniref:uncharacterized protein LOC135471018 n=1 Tax=Liolophura sinensis TaxID=3198878 RepID=UPI00315985C0